MHGCDLVYLHSLLDVDCMYSIVHVLIYPDLIGAQEQPGEFSLTPSGILELPNS